MIMKKELRFVVNGEPRDLWVEPKTLLVQVLRNELGLTGTKRGCDEGACCVCTVIVNGKAVKSCSMLALQANGKDVMTIEGLAINSKLHPIQEAYLDKGAFQCGFCTPGRIMGTKALLDENPTPDLDEIKIAMDGHICRCTGYNMIHEAVDDAAKRLQALNKAGATK
jgi:aerobic-type carbon monoxide dehydrogenase small subunit (CoxS/CutS family)